MAESVPGEFIEQLSEVPKREVIVQVTFIKIGEIDTLKQFFEADVLIRSKWRETELDNMQSSLETDFSSFWNPKVFIENTVGEAKVKANISLELNPEGEAYLVERRRVTGRFMEQLELWEFPFDVQDLSLCLMSGIEKMDLELIDDPTEMHKIYKQSFIDEHEWYLYKYIESVHSDKPSDIADPTTTKCCMTVQCRAARRPDFFLWNVLSVTFLICCLVFVTFSVDPRLPQNRLQLTITLVLTAVAYKFVVNQSLPKVPYLTYLDGYVLMALLLLACVCFWHAIVTLIRPREEADVIAFGAFIGVFALCNIGYGAKILSVPYHKRRDMKRRETRYMSDLLEETQRKLSSSSSVQDPLLEDLEDSRSAPTTWSKTKRLAQLFSVGKRHGTNQKEKEPLDNSKMETP